MVVEWNFKQQMKKNEVLMHLTAWIILTSIMLSQKAQDNTSMIPYAWNTKQARQIYGDRNQLLWYYEEEY